MSNDRRDVGPNGPADETKAKKNKAAKEEAGPNGPALSGAAAAKALASVEANMIAASIKKLQPEASNRQIAKVLGVGETTVRRDGAPGEKKTRKTKGGETLPAPNGAPLSGAAAAKALASVEAGEMWVNAEAKIGIELAKLPKAKGTRGQGRPKLGGSKSVPPRSDEPATLEELGVDKKRATRAQKLAAMPVAERNWHIEQLKEIAEAARRRPCDKIDRALSHSRR